MIQAEYRRELNHSYMVIKNAIPQLTQQYAYRMIRENRIRRLLSCQERMVDGESCLYFEISSRQALGQFYEGRSLDADQIGQILRSIVQLQEDMGEFLLDGASLLLEPACMFIDVETEELYFCFYPGWGKGQNPYVQLADFFLEHVDHGHEPAVNLAYQFYKLSKSGSFVLSSFMPYVEKECAKMGKNVPTEGTQMWITSRNPAEAQGERASRNGWTSQGSDRVSQDTQGSRNGRDISDDAGRAGQKRGQEKKGWLRRFFIKRLPGGKHERQKDIYSQKGRVENGELEYGESLWDVYADKLENKEAGETIYFSDLEKPVPKPVGTPFLMEIGSSRRFSLETLPVTVGKLSTKAGIVLDDPSVSRVHARFFSEAQDVWLMDLNSKNGTMINGKKLSPNEAAKVEMDDEIQFGRERFQFTFIDSQKE